MSRKEDNKYVRNPSTSRLPSLRDGITVIWLTSRASLLKDDIEMVTRLQALYDHTFLCYTKISKAMKYMNRAKPYEYLIVVVSELGLQFSKTVFNQLQKSRQVRTVLMVPKEEEELDFITLIMETFDKIVICREHGSLSIELQQFLQDFTTQMENDDNFIIYNDNEKALRDVRNEPGAFAWDYFNILVLSEMPYDSADARDQFLKECRAIYRGNSVQLAKILEFDQTYRACDAIYWYTKPDFVFRIINRALRSGDMLILFKFRYFLVDMYKNLAATATTQSSLPIHVYRGATLAKEEVEKLTVGSCITVTSFFSSSSNIQVARGFTIDKLTGMLLNRSRNDKHQFVLFEIAVDPTTIRVADIIVANVSSQSVIPEEEEVLFGPGTTFNIIMIKYDVEHYLWNIKMDVSSEAAAIKREQREYIRGSLRGTSATCLFGCILVDIWSQYTQARIYFYDLLQTLPTDHIDRPHIFYQLGRVYRFLGQFKIAIAYFRCAQLFKRRLLPQSTLDYGSIVSALGATYSEMGDSKRAVHLHERAIAVHSGHLSKYDRERAFHGSRLAYACYQEKQYERALSVLDDIEIVFKARIPDDYRALAQVLHTRGSVYQALGDHEQALDYLKKALNMRESWLSKDHPAVARTCYQLALLYKERGEYRLAFEYAERALRIQELKLPKTHQERKWSQQVVERLKCHIDSLSFCQ